jgi:hypothetical protein
LRSVGGVRVQAFCGPARATVHVAGKTVVIRNGRCLVSPGIVLVNIGSHATPLNARYSDFGLTVNATRPGTYTVAQVTLDLGTTGYLIAGKKVKLNPGLRSGSFSGSDAFSGKPIAGTFSC